MIHRPSDEILSRILKKSMATGADYGDIFIEHQRPLTIQLEDDKIEKLSSGVDAGIGVRVIFGDKSAYAFSNDFSEDSLYSIAETVSRAVKDRERSDRVFDLTRGIQR